MWSILIMPFQSSRPIRGATNSLSGWRVLLSNFNPRAPYGARLLLLCYRNSVNYFNPRAPYGARRNTPNNGPQEAKISILAPHTGRDIPCCLFRILPVIFQSSRPIRGATRFRLPQPFCFTYFNPRAPYGARPAYISNVSKTTADFNPRAPYGARL